MTEVFWPGSRPSTSSGTLVATTVLGPIPERRRRRARTSSGVIRGVQGSSRRKATSVMFGVMMSARVMSQRIFSTISGVMVASSTPLSPSTGSTTARPPGARQVSMQRATDSICSGEAIKPE